MEGDRIVIIGAGNVATHLARAFDSAGSNVLVYSRNAAHSSAVVNTLQKGSQLDTPGDIPVDADLYIISVKDDAIASVCDMLRGVSGIVAHTSGSVPIEVLSGTSDRIAVIYPLQTFSRDADLDIAEVPFFTEASDVDTLAAVDAKVRKISRNLHHAASADRRLLHVAAVFGCNFVNHLWALAEDILKDGGYSLDVLYPLMRLTFDKAMAMSPHDGQTGPARRGDNDIIDKHIAMLPDDKKEIYRMISQSITERYRNEQN